MSPKLPTLASVFRARLPKALAAYQVDEPGIVLRVPAAAADVGDLVVYANGHELTVEVGRISHSHFPADERHYPCCAAGQNAQPIAADAAIFFIQETLSQRLTFRLNYVDGRLVSCSHLPSEEAEFDDGECRSDIEFKEFTWKGLNRHVRADDTE